MKRVNFLMVALLILVSTAVTSCVNGNNESSFDALAYVTVEDGMYGVVLLTDDGFRLIPTNPEALKTSASEYVKRAQIALKWGEGVVFNGDRTKTYQMTIVDAAGIPTKMYCNMPDTIKKTYPLLNLSDVSGANGQYLTVPFTFGYSGRESVSFDLYPVKAEGDELVMKLVQSVGSENGYNEQSYFISFDLPTVDGINQLLEQYKDRDDVEGGVLDVPANDSILVKVIADGRYEEVLESKQTKIKIRNY